MGCPVPESAKEGVVHRLLVEEVVPPATKPLEDAPIEVKERDFVNLSLSKNVKDIGSIL